MAIAILQNAGAGMPTYEIKEKVEKNGEIVITPDTGYGFSKVTLDVSVPVEDHGVIDGSLTSCEVPAEAKCVKPYCFYNCSDLESVTFDDNSQCEKIGSYAFDSCINLKTVKFPEKCCEIGEGAFNGCSSMTTYDLTSCEVVPKIENDSICTDGDPQILVPTTLYHEFCDHKNWKEYVEHFECDALERVKTESFSQYLDYQNICQIYQTINKDKADGIIKNDQYKYVRICSRAGENEILVGGYIGIYSSLFSYTAGKYLVIKYRSKLAAEDEGRMTDYIEVWATTANKGKFENGDQFSVHVQRDGRWHTIVLDVESSLGENAQYTPGSTLRGFRIDVFNQQGGNTFATNNSYFDIAYVGMCDDRNNAIAADPDYSGAEFDCYDLSSMLCGDIKTSYGESYALIGSEVRATPSGMNYVHIEADIDYSAKDRGEVYSYIYKEDALLPNVGKYAAVLYTGLESETDDRGLVQVWKSSKNTNVNGQNPNKQIKYTACKAGKDGWRYGVAELSGTDYTEDVCRSIRLDYIDGYDEWNYDTYNVTLNIAFLKFFDNADDAAAYCEAYMDKYKLWEET